MYYPKVELHCHLDGAIPYDLFVRYSREDGFIPDGVSDKEWLAENVMREDQTLSECLNRFVVLTGILQTEEHLSECTYTLLNNLYNQGLRLVELRFAPQSHLQKGLSMEQAVEAVLEGQRKALAEHPDLVSGIILCMMNYGQNWGSEERNTETVYLAKRYLEEGVVAIDLAGDELASDYSNYLPQFQLAKAMEIPFTIHAGESGPASNVAFALDLGATRIGHGVHCVQDPAVWQRVIDTQTLLEVSLTSNVLSQSVASYARHPVRRLLDSGVRLCINTDDPGLMDTSIPEEYDKLRFYHKFTEKEFIQTNLWAAEYSFCPGKEKVIDQLKAALSAL